MSMDPVWDIVKTSRCYMNDLDKIFQMITHNVLQDWWFGRHISLKSGTCILQKCNYHAIVDQEMRPIAQCLGHANTRNVIYLSSK